jgi:hypothetical protein
MTIKLKRTLVMRDVSSLYLDRVGNVVTLGLALLLDILLVLPSRRTINDKSEDA